MKRSGTSHGACSFRMKSQIWWSRSTGELLAGACVEEGAQAMAPAGMPQFPERLGFDLPDALASDREMLADFFERVLAAVLQAEAHLDDLLFARAESLQDLGRLLAQIQIDYGFGRRSHAAVDDEVAQMRFFFFADGRFERDRLLRDAQHLADFADGQFQPPASSSVVGSRPSSCCSCRCARTSLLMVSIMCTGMRMVRA